MDRHPEEVSRAGPGPRAGLALGGNFIVNEGKTRVSKGGNYPRNEE